MDTDHFDDITRVLSSGASRRRVLAGVFGTLLASIGLAEAGAGGKKGKKICFCHVPSGNPEEAHVICVSKKASKAHKNHGDCICQNRECSNCEACAPDPPVICRGECETNADCRPDVAATGRKGHDDNDETACLCVGDHGPHASSGDDKRECRLQKDTCGGFCRVLEDCQAPRPAGLNDGAVECVCEFEHDGEGLNGDGIGRCVERRDVCPGLCNNDDDCRRKSFGKDDDDKVECVCVIIDGPPPANANGFEGACEIDICPGRCKEDDDCKKPRSAHDSDDFECFCRIADVAAQGGDDEDGRCESRPVVCRGECISDEQCEPVVPAPVDGEVRCVCEFKDDKKFGSNDDNGTCVRDICSGRDCREFCNDIELASNDHPDRDPCREFGRGCACFCDDANSEPVEPSPLFGTCQRLVKEE
jgi:hypothetical protein